jgi:hypothetical protein
MELRLMARRRKGPPYYVTLSDVREFVALTSDWPGNTWAHCVIAWNGVTSGPMTGLRTNVTTVSDEPGPQKIADRFNMTLTDVRDFVALADDWPDDTQVDCTISMDSAMKISMMLGLEATDDSEWLGRPADNR